MNNNFSLPSSSIQENLETISRNKFALLFDVKLFELRPETQRDKGIDVTIEIKKDSQYTNFRFAVQLKSTSTSKFNKDGSVSFPVGTSNINYLLNCGMPTYYVLYEHNSGKFYIEKTVGVYQNLIKKYKSKKLPETFKVKFHNEITPEVIREVYQSAFTYGDMLKQIKIATSGFDQKGGIVIDSNNRVFSVEENITFINHYGFFLLNNASFDQIIEIEQRTHPRIKASATFNLVCGVAYFQRANLFKALEFLKLAQRDITEFSNEIQSMFTYTFLQAKHLLGILDENDFNQEVSSLLNSENLGSSLQIERAYTHFLKGELPDVKGIQAFYEAITNILSEEPDNASIRTFAYAQILEVELKVLLNDFVKNVAFVIESVSDFQETNLYKHWLKLQGEYTSRLNLLAKFAWEQQNFLALGNITMTKINWTYAKLFLVHVLKNWNKVTSNVNKVALEGEDLKVISENISKIDSVAKGYESLQHKENLILCLFTKYELLHFADRMDEANLLGKQILELINANDLNATKIKFHKLINGGTRYEKFIKQYTATSCKIYEVAKNSGIEDKFLQGKISNKVADILHNEVTWSIPSFFHFEI